tara:strand:- start:623 stop:1072 length:450 start_codon:yes stop_codon:yes gene_type:complete
MIKESDEQPLSSMRFFWKSELGELKFIKIVNKYKKIKNYSIDDDGLRALHMALIGTESRSHKETNESVEMAAKHLADRLNMNDQVDAYFHKQGKGELPARHHVLHSTIERSRSNDLDLDSSTSIGGAFSVHAYGDYLKNQNSFRKEFIR